jgi:hypothetical protein
MDDVGICILWPFGLFQGHLFYFKAIWSISRLFGLFQSHLVYFTVIWYILLSFEYILW